jgi:hypothetical protein
MNQKSASYDATAASRLFGTHRRGFEWIRNNLSPVTPVLMLGSSYHQGLIIDQYPKIGFISSIFARLSLLN